jgi:hypothetical protein
VKRFIVYRLHYNGERGFYVLPAGATHSGVVIERVQRKLKREGRRTGITWQCHDGSIVSAMVASSKL